MNVGEVVHRHPDVRRFEKSKRMVFHSLVGVEVELENMRHGEGLRVPYWEIKGDGSLRNHGLEFVLDNPLSGRDLPRAMIALEKAIREGGLKPDLSDRTSVHVHVDVRDMTADQLFNMIILYTVFERVLFNYAGKERHDNVFCMSFEAAQDNVQHVCKMRTTEPNTFLGVFQHTDRYSACNLASIPRFGSLEFRLHKGEWRAAPILRWINILLSLKKYAMTVPMDIDDLPSDISSIGVESFTRRVFAKFADHLIYRGYEEDILSGVRLAQDIIYHQKMDECHSLENCGEEDTPFNQYLKAKGIEPSKSFADADKIAFLMDVYGFSEDASRVMLEEIPEQVESLMNNGVGGEE